MTKLFLIIILNFLSIVILAQTISGTVEEYESGYKIADAELVLRINDRIKYYTRTDIKGKFKFKNVVQNEYDLVVFKIGYPSEKIDKVILNSKSISLLVLMKEGQSGIICTEKIKYICEENNPEYEYKINNENTTNFTDSLGKKQGLWVKTYNRHTDKKMKYLPNQLINKGYYKNDKKIGRWIYLKPNGKVKKVITFDMDKVISIKKCTPENFPQ